MSHQIIGFRNRRHSRSPTASRLQTRLVIFIYVNTFSHDKELSIAKTDSFAYGV